MKIISGFQSGVDIAAIRAAKKASFETGGWMPAGFLKFAEDGTKTKSPGLADLGAKETPSKEWTERTQWNVRDSDATLILTLDLSSPGTIATRKAIKAYSKPSRVIVINGGDTRESLYGTGVVASISLWMSAFKTVNIAGNRYAWLEEPVETWLTKIFECVKFWDEFPEEQDAQIAAGEKAAADLVVASRDPSQASFHTDSTGNKE